MEEREELREEGRRGQQSVGRWAAPPHQLAGLMRSVSDRRVPVTPSPVPCPQLPPAFSLSLFPLVSSVGVITSFVVLMALHGIID